MISIDGEGFGLFMMTRFGRLPDWERFELKCLRLNDFLREFGPFGF